VVAVFQDLAVRRHGPGGMWIGAARQTVERRSSRWQVGDGSAEQRVLRRGVAVPRDEPGPGNAVHVEEDEKLSTRRDGPCRTGVPRRGKGKAVARREVDDLGTAADDARDGGVSHGHHDVVVGPDRAGGQPGELTA
jgi:hypothetical protein